MFIYHCLSNVLQVLADLDHHDVDPSIKINEIKKYIFVNLFTWLFGLPGWSRLFRRARGRNMKSKKAIASHIPNIKYILVIPVPSPPPVFVWPGTKNSSEIFYHKKLFDSSILTWTSKTFGISTCCLCIAKHISQTIHSMFMIHLKHILIHIK
jgi:hypothetical protein